MLDAAEQLFREGGSGALTVEAIIERAGTSTGAFYARFGSRRGLFVAMHERFLVTFESSLREAAVDALASPSLRDALHVFVNGVVSTVRRHRDTANFHVIQNAHDPEMRAQGNELTRGLFVLLEKITESHPLESGRADSNKIDMMGRAIFGLTLQLMLFDDDEVSGRAITHDQMVDRLIEMCVSYLTQT
jgi:AcrR family transcriptional regulator